jgi:glycosyltransferase involved in cell wall biosynthesis
MRILLLTQVVPFPPDSGPKIKTYNVLRYLAQRHEVCLASFVRSPEESAQAEPLREHCAHVVTVELRRSPLRDLGYLARSLKTGRPFLVERDDRAAMRDAINRAVVTYQPYAVHADQLSMAQFAAGARVPLRVLDEHNAVWTIVRRAAQNAGRGPRRVLAELEWRKLKAYEGRVCCQFDQVTVVSDEDRLALEAAARRRLPARVIPITVDTDRLTFLPRSADARHVLSVATMYYPPNVEAVSWFATRVFPMVKSALPGTRFLIVGRRPPKTIARLATRDASIVVSGYVADLTPIDRQSGVLVVPVSSGSGMRVKILEAFARGIPVVSTTVGVEGIGARAGEHLMVADEPKEFADAVVRVLSQPALSARLAEAGRAFVEQRHDWRTALGSLDELYGPPPADGGPATTSS